MQNGARNSPSRICYDFRRFETETLRAEAEPKSIRRKKMPVPMPPGMDFRGKQYVGRILEKSEACAKRMVQDPIVLAASRNEMADEQWFKLLARF